MIQRANRHNEVNRRRHCSLIVMAGVLSFVFMFLMFKSAPKRNIEPVVETEEEEDEATTIIEEETVRNTRIPAGFTYVTPQQALNDICSDESEMMRLSDRYFDQYSKAKVQTFTDERVEEEKQAWSNFYMTLQSLDERPSLFGRHDHDSGIVLTCGGRYWSMCMANIRLLTEVHQVYFPIEVWVDDKDVDNHILQSIVSNFSNVIPRCFSEMSALYNAWLGQFRGGDTNVGRKNFHLKVMALIGSNIRNVMYVDADSFALRNPEYLFLHEMYMQRGALFWPDMYGISRDSLIWKTMGIEYRDMWAQESGQMLVDKQKHWRQLLVAAFLNNRQDYYYSLVNGDKDTFLASWIATNASYFMIPYPPTPAGQTKRDGLFCGNAFIQSDMERLPVFIHAVGSKDLLIRGVRAWKCVKVFDPLIGYPYYRWKDGCIDISDAKGGSEILSASSFIGNIEDAIKFLIVDNNPQNP